MVPQQGGRLACEWLLLRPIPLGRLTESHVWLYFGGVHSKAVLMRRHGLRRSCHNLIVLISLNTDILNFRWKICSARSQSSTACSSTEHGSTQEIGPFPPYHTGLLLMVILLSTQKKRGLTSLGLRLVKLQKFKENSTY